jgi:hypothetical protein
MEQPFEKSGKIPTFDGESKNFPSWWKKFLAYATISKFKNILKEERAMNLPEKEVSGGDFSKLI